MPQDIDDSNGDENPLETGEDAKNTGPDSLSDEMTFAGGTGLDHPQSLGDDPTSGFEFASTTDAVDEDMEIVDLEARYTIEGVLGKGGMGEVLLATDKRLHRKVAIKRIVGNAARSRTAARRFLTEARSIAALNHPNVIQIYEYGRAADGPFLIMEYVEGKTLLEQSSAGPLPLDQAVDLISQVCDGLSRAHEAGVVHRDIKPANVLLTRDGLPKLTDFGIAKAESHEHTMTMAGAVIGTLDFMPPEQRLDATKVDERSDLWSLAATLYQLVTGETPRVIDLDAVPGELRSFMTRALKSKQEDRFQTANEFSSELRAISRPAEAVAPDPVDLTVGECPKCHTKNDANRKFCNGCGGSLRETCLACDADIPLWDRFCGECGGDVSKLVREKELTYKDQQQQAETLLSDLDFSQSASIATELSEITDARFQTVRDWAVSFQEQITSQRVAAQTEAARHFAEAKTHREAFDYVAAGNAMDSIPESVRDQEMLEFTQNLLSDHEESQRLLLQIKTCLENRQVDDLLPTVNRAIELRGDRKDLQKLVIQLQEREAKQMQIPKKAAEKQLMAAVREAKASEDLSLEQIANLLHRSSKYLRLDPDHAQIKSFQNDVKTRFINKFRIQCPAFKPLPSSAVISSLAAICNATEQEVRGVVDGFWAHVITDKTYADKEQLTIPFFGTFSRMKLEEYRTDARVRSPVTGQLVSVSPKNVTRHRIVFRSRTLPEIQNAMKKRVLFAPSTLWIKRIKANRLETADLSVKRRMAVAIAQEQQMPVEVTYRVLYSLFDLLSLLFTAGISIRWFTRGEMYPKKLTNGITYRFRNFENAFLTEK